MPTYRHGRSLGDIARLVDLIGGVEVVAQMSNREVRRALAERGEKVSVHFGGHATIYCQTLLATRDGSVKPPQAPRKALGGQPPVDPMTAPISGALFHESHPPPSPETPIREQFRASARKFDRLAAHWAGSEERVIHVNGDEPIGLGVMGDPHLDDDGCDLRLMCRWLDVWRELPRVQGINVGDTVNGWAGKLSRLYKNQSTTEVEAFERSAWFASACRWLAWVHGNHDHWGQNGLILRWILAHPNSRVKVVADHGARICMEWPSGEKFRIYVRHTFKGHSQWNPAHGLVKAALMPEYRADVYIDGHKHDWVEVCQPRRDGTAFHAIRVRGFKRFDAYGDSLGFVDHPMNEACLLMVYPWIKGRGRVRTYWTPEEARRGYDDAMRAHARHKQSTGDAR